MLWLQVCLIVYALVMLLGGTMGFVMAHSVPSLVTGIVSSMLLLGSAAWAKTTPKLGYGLATVVVLVLIGVFIERSTKVEKPMMSYMLAGGSTLMLILLVVGHFMNRSKPI